MKQVALGFRYDAFMAVLTTQVSVANVGHDALTGN